MTTEVVAWIIKWVRAIPTTFRVTSFCTDGGCTGHWALPEHPVYRHGIIVSINHHIVARIFDIKRFEDEFLFLDFRASVPLLLYFYIQLLSRHLIVDLIYVGAIQMLITFFILTYVLNRHDLPACHSKSRSSFVRPVGLRCVHGGQVWVVI